MATSLNARLAELRDAPAIAEIYNQGIEDRTATFETEPRTAETIRELMSEYRPRSACAVVAEFAIYVARGARGRGVGRLALGALLTEAERLSPTWPTRWPVDGLRDVERLLGAAARDEPRLSE